MGAVSVRGYEEVMGTMYLDSMLKAVELQLVSI